MPNPFKSWSPKTLRKAITKVLGKYAYHDHEPAEKVADRIVKLILQGDRNI